MHRKCPGNAKKRSEIHRQECSNNNNNNKQHKHPVPAQEEEEGLEYMESLENDVTYIYIGMFRKLTTILSKCQQCSQKLLKVFEKLQNLFSSVPMACVPMASVPGPGGAPGPAPDLGARPQAPARPPAILEP